MGTILAVITIVPFSHGIQTPVPSPESWAWVHEVEDKVWNRLAVVDPSEAVAAAKGKEWVVVVTAHDGYSYHWQLVLRKAWQSDPTAEFLYLEGNLASQLIELRERGLEARAMEGSPSIAKLFTHIHFVRLVFVFEDAPEFAGNLPEEEWVAERDPGRIAEMLNDSAKAVRDAVKSRVEAGRDMNLHYDHPILLLQHMLWHEGYHHGQMKLALKVAGRPMTDEEAGPLTWDVWMRKK